MKGLFQDLPKLQGQVFPEVGIWDLQAKVASNSWSQGLLGQALHQAKNSRAQVPRM